MKEKIEDERKVELNDELGGMIKEDSKGKRN